MNRIKLNNYMAYLIGVIIGDGHISNACKSTKDKSKDYRITLDVIDKEYAQYVLELIKSFVDTKTTVKEAKKKNNRKQRYYVQVRNKELHTFLSQVVGLPKGNKSSCVKIPKIILEGNYQLKISVISGLFDTDGGFRAGTIGFTTASQTLRDQTSYLLHEFEIFHSKDEWINKKYTKKYFGIRISKQKIGSFLNKFKLCNVAKARRINSRFPL